jgi:hypothetical protein
MGKVAAVSGNVAKSLWPAETQEEPPPIEVSWIAQPLSARHPSWGVNGEVEAVASGLRSS